MPPLNTLLPLLAALLPLTAALTQGFPKERCDDMDPTKVTLPPSKLPPDDNLTEFGGEEDRPPTSIRQSDSLNLYRISTPGKYRRGRTMEISIRGPDFNAVLLEVRAVGSDERRGFDRVERKGEFARWPASLRPLACGPGTSPTALTNKDYATKGDLSVAWRAPADDAGVLHVVARFVYGDEYFPVTESKPIYMNEFPLNLKRCGKDKSCVLFSEQKSSCHEDSCDYVLAYSVRNGTVDFAIGGSAPPYNTYLAVGFSDTREAEKMKIVACSRVKPTPEIKYFTFNDVEEGLIEQPMEVEGATVDVEEERMWCGFSLPVASNLGEDFGLDLSLPLYQLYLRGTVNDTKDMNIPILPTKLHVSKNEIPVDKIKLQYLTMEAPVKQKSSAMTAAVSWMSIVLLALLHPAWQKTRVTL